MGSTKIHIMDRDILLQIVVEKIRKDFGDYCASIFQILSLTKGCTFIELNKTIRSAYTTIRSSIFLLFQNNLIYFDNNIQLNPSVNALVKKIRFIPCIKEAFNRFNYFRYTIFTECEYGNSASKIIEFILSKGNSFPNEILKIFKRKNNYKKVQNLLIHLARDNMIKTVFSPFFKKQLTDEKFHVPQKKFYSDKPWCGNRAVCWKVNSNSYNSYLRKNILLETIHEYFPEKLKTLAKFCLSKVLSENLQKKHLFFFSLDTLKDVFTSISEYYRIDEIEVFQEIEKQFSQNFFIKLYQSYFKWNFSYLEKIFRERLADNILANQLGKNFLKIFSLLKHYPHTNVKEIREISFMEDKAVRKILLYFYRSGFVFIDEKKKHIVPSTDTEVFYWKLNYKSIQKRLFYCVFKSFYNIFLRNNSLNIFHMKFITKNNNNSMNIQKYNTYNKNNSSVGSIMSNIILFNVVEMFFLLF